MLRAEADDAKEEGRESREAEKEKRA